jgi:hypothetical protein
VGVNLPCYSCSCTLHSLVETDISARKLKIYSDEWFDWPTPPNAFLKGEFPISILQEIMCSISINLVLCVCHLFQSKGSVVILSACAYPSRHYALHFKELANASYIKNDVWDCSENNSTHHGFFTY